MRGEGEDYFDRVVLGKNKARKPILWVRLCAILALLVTTVQISFVAPSILSFVSHYTNWGFVLTLIAFILLFLSTLTATQPQNTLRLLDKCAFFAFELAWTSETVVTVFFWTALIWFNIPLMKNNLPRLLCTIESHALPQFMLVADYCLNSMRFVKRHLYYAMIPAAVYTVLTIILAYTIDLVPYTILTWKDWLSVGVAVLLLLFFVGAFFLGYCIGECKARNHNPTEVTPSDILISS